MKIAISGKGGVGKTTIAGLLACSLAREGKKVIVVDADPDSNLPSIFGIKDEITPISNMLELIQKRTSAYHGIFKLNPKVDDLLDRYGIKACKFCKACESLNINLLVLGTIKKADTRCFCPETALLRALVRHLILTEEYLIMDMDAGIEHLGRGAVRGVDRLVIIVEPGQKSIDTANKIKNLASQLGIENIIAVINKITKKKEAEVIMNRLHIPVVCTIPYDEEIAKADLEGKPLGIVKSRQIMKEIEKLKISIGDKIGES